MSEPVAEEWESESERLDLETRVFAVSSVARRSPRSGKTHEFARIDSPDWVNVIPVTPQGEVVLVRQFRHGVGAITLEIPGGSIEASDASAEVGGARELLEETGYRATRYAAIGWVHPNPAIQSNRCHSFLALDAERVAPIQGDSTEETEVVRVAWAAIPRMLRSGEISHALVVAAFHKLLLEPGLADEITRRVRYRR